jgi:hypothetical protein
MESLPHIKKYLKWGKKGPHEKRPKKEVEHEGATSFGEGVCSGIPQSTKEAKGRDLGPVCGSNRL